MVKKRKKKKINQLKLLVLLNKFLTRELESKRRMNPKLMRLLMKQENKPNLRNRNVKPTEDTTFGIATIIPKTPSSGKDALSVFVMSMIKFWRTLKTSFC